MVPCTSYDPVARRPSYASPYEHNQAPITCDASTSLLSHAFSTSLSSCGENVGLYAPNQYIQTEACKVVIKNISTANSEKQVEDLTKWACQTDSSFPIESFHCPKHAGKLHSHALAVLRTYRDAKNTVDKLSQFVWHGRKISLHVRQRGRWNRGPFDPLASRQLGNHGYYCDIVHIDTEVRLTIQGEGEGGLGT